MRVIKYLSLIILPLFLIMGCSSSSEKEAQELVNKVTGTVEASYLKGVTVCEASSNNYAVTDENGKFTLSGVSYPANLVLKIGNSILGEATIDSEDTKITPKVLADGNETLASYVGAFLHKVADCNMSASVCDLLNVNSVDIDENSDDALIDELKKAVDKNQTVAFKVNGNDNNISLSDALTYASENPTMLSNKVKFKGALNGGDYATFSFDRESKVLSYSVKGNIFPNGAEGNITLTPLANTESFYKDANDNFYFITKSIGIANIDINDTASGFVVGLQNPVDTIDPSLIVNKRYYTFYITEDPTNGTIAQLSVVDINASSPNDTNGTWYRFDKNGDSESGVWELNGSKLIAKDLNGTTVGTAILRAGPEGSRVGFVMDFIQGGIAIGVEARELSASEISGRYEIFNYENYENGHQQCIGNVEVNGTEFRYVMTQCSGEDSENVGVEYNGTLTLNPEINGTQYNGLIKINNDEGEYLLIDSVGGYFIDVIIGENDVLDSITIGSNKALQ